MAYLFHMEGQVFGKPGRRRQQLASVMDREVVRVDRIWREEGQEQWLVSFYVTEIKGRMECVGLGLRSYLALRETPERGHPHDVWVPCPMRAYESDDDRAVWDKLNFGGEAPALWERAEEQLGLPMPLNATQVRRLPFGHLLDLATREEARRLNLSINRF